MEGRVYKEPAPPLEELRVHAAHGCSHHHIIGIQRVCKFSEGSHGEFRLHGYIRGDDFIRSRQRSVETPSGRRLSGTPHSMKIHYFHNSIAIVFAYKINTYF